MLTDANHKSPGTVSRIDLRAAEIRRETAERKMALLSRIAQSAVDAAQDDLQTQQLALERFTKLKEAHAISTAQFEQAQRQFRAAQSRLKILETFPGVNAGEDKEAQ